MYSFIFQSTDTETFLYQYSGTYNFLRLDNLYKHIYHIWEIAFNDWEDSEWEDSELGDENYEGRIAFKKYAAGELKTLQEYIDADIDADSVGKVLSWIDLQIDKLDSFHQSWTIDIEDMFFYDLPKENREVIMTAISNKAKLLTTFS